MRPLPVMMAELTPLLGQLEAPRPASGVLEASSHLETVGMIYLALIAAGVAVNIHFLARWFRDALSWRRGVSRLIWRPWSRRHLGQLGGVIVGVHLGLFLFTLLYRRATGVHLWEHSGIALFMEGMAFHVAGLAGLVIMMGRRGLSWNSGFGVSRHGFMHKVTLGGACYLAALPFIGLSAYLYEGVLEWMGQDVGPQVIFDELMRPDSPWTLILITVLAIIIAPVFEELLFRGLGLPLLAKRFGMPAGVLLISLLFALIHFHVPSLVPLFVFAIALALAYVYSQSIVTPIIMHALFNGINLVFFTVLKA